MVKRAAIADRWSRPLAAQDLADDLRPLDKLSSRIATASMQMYSAVQTKDSFLDVSGLFCSLSLLSQEMNIIWDFGSRQTELRSSIIHSLWFLEEKEHNRSPKVFTVTRRRVCVCVFG